MNRIKTIQYSEASGRLLEIYDEIISKRGKLAEVHKIQSLRPESIIKHMDLYMEIMFTKSELSRADREMMAIIVSITNGCEYCKDHHSEALNHYWKDRTKISELILDYKSSNLDKRKTLLCDFAEHLTKYPEKFQDTDFIEHLKNIGFSDHAILDATLVIAYFNFVNRIVLALNVESNEDERKGYNF